MALSPLTSSDAGAIARAKINAALSELDSLRVGLVQEAEARDGQIQATGAGLTQYTDDMVRIEAEARDQQVRSLIQGISDTVTTTENRLRQIIDQVAGETSDTLSRFQAAERAERAALLAAEALLRAEDDAAIRRDTLTAFRLGSRPGDAPDLYTTAPASALPDRPRPGVGQTAVTALGRVWRVIGSVMLSRRVPLYLEPGRVRLLRWTYARAANPNDPAGDAVQCGITWATRERVAISETIVDVANDVAVISGPRSVSARVPSQPGDPVTIVPPAGAIYAFPWIRTFGSDGVTDLVLIDDQDVTDTGSYSPDLTAERARIAALEALVAALDPLAAGTANGLATLNGQGHPQQVIPALAGITRAEIPNSVIPLARFRAVDGSVWRRGTSAGPRAIQDLAGVWWQIDLSAGPIKWRWMGAVGDGVADDTAAINAALALGGAQDAEDLVYRVTNSINFVAPSTVLNGTARIRLDAPTTTPPSYEVHYVATVTGAVTDIGAITLDGDHRTTANRAITGLRLAGPVERLILRETEAVDCSFKGFDFSDNEGIWRHGTLEAHNIRTRNTGWSGIGVEGFEYAEIISAEMYRSGYGGIYHRRCGTFIETNGYADFSEPPFRIYDGPGNPLATTSQTDSVIETGLKTFVLDVAPKYRVGKPLIVTSGVGSTLNAANWMKGKVTAYDRTAKTVTINITEIGGSGGYTNWTIVGEGGIAYTDAPSTLRYTHVGSVCVDNINAHEDTFGIEEAGNGGAWGTGLLDACQAIRSGQFAFDARPNAEMRNCIADRCDAVGMFVGFDTGSEMRGFRASLTVIDGVPGGYPVLFGAPLHEGAITTFRDMEIDVSVIERRPTDRVAAAVGINNGPSVIYDNVNLRVLQGADVPALYVVTAGGPQLPAGLNFYATGNKWLAYTPVITSIVGSQNPPAVADLSYRLEGRKAPLRGTITAPANSIAGSGGLFVSLPLAAQTKRSVLRGVVAETSTEVYGVPDGAGVVFRASNGLHPFVSSLGSVQTLGPVVT